MAGERKSVEQLHGMHFVTHMAEGGRSSEVSCASPSVIATWQTVVVVFKLLSHGPIQTLNLVLDSMSDTTLTRPTVECFTGQPVDAPAHEKSLIFNSSRRAKTLLTPLTVDIDIFCFVSYIQNQEKHCILL